MPKRKCQWKGYRRGDADYVGNFRCALPTTSSTRTRQAVLAAANVNEALAIHDTSHLFIDEVLETTGGGECTITYYDPARMIQYVLDNCETLSQLYGEIAMANPGQEWRLIMGYDEQTPGSKISRENLRKNMVITMNFIEAGAEVLESDDSWFIPFVCRSDLLNKVRGSWSTVLRRFLRRAILSATSVASFPLLVRFTHEDVQRVARITARLHTLLTDGEGHQKTLEWNGPSSLRPSFDFANVFMKDAGMVDPVANYVDITCSDLSLFRRWSDDSWHRNVDSVLAARERHQRGEITKTVLKNHIKGAGFCVTPEGLLADPDLREKISFLDTCVYDFMHTSFQEGFMSNAMWLMCSSVLRVKYGGDGNGAPLVAYLREFQFPHSRTEGKQLHRVFTDKMMKKHKNRNCILANASIQMSLHQLLECWAIRESSGCGELMQHCAVFCAACEIVAVYMKVKHRRMDTVTAKAALLVAIAKWQNLHKLLYGIRYFKPKFFWIWSIAMDLTRSEFVFDMFSVERQHRRVRKQVEPIKNTRQFEGTVLQRVLDAQITSLQGVDLIAKKYKIGERNVRRACGGEPASMADVCVCRGVKLHVDDIVEHDTDIGVITACYQCDSNALLVVSVELMRKLSPTRFQQTAVERLWKASAVKSAIAWRSLGDRDVEVVRAW